MQTVREEWLQRATDQLRPIFGAQGYEVPRIQVSVGFPRRGKKGTIGQCWSPENAGDKLHHIFISPVVSDGVQAVATLAHELVHATVGLRARHGKAFKQCATSIGLEGKMTATVPGAKLAEFASLLPLAYVAGITGYDRMGDYPQPTFDIDTMDREKDSTRLIKLECPACKCIVRITRKWLVEIGPPTCGCGTRMDVA